MVVLGKYLSFPIIAMGFCNKVVGIFSNSLGFVIKDSC